MIRSLVVLFAALFVGGCGSSSKSEDEHGHEGGHEAAESFERGSHGGRLLEQEGFALELAIFESGVPPEFRAWLYEDNKPLPADAASVTVELGRLGGGVDRFEFEPQGEFLRGRGVVEEPHSFDVVVRAVRNGKTREWQYESYEGRTAIAANVAKTMGVTTSEAGPVTLQEGLSLSGVIQADPARVSRVRARFPGVVREVGVQPWATVSRGAVLAQVQSNESLQNYSITAPIGGVLVEHRAQVGEATGEEALFTIIDLTKVWVELDVFQNDLARISEQQPVRVLDLDGRKLADGRLSRIAPLAVHGSQSVRARVVIDNATGQLRPGQFVTAQVTVAEIQVPLAVRRDAIQRFRDFDVVFEQIDDTYEVRMLELGRADAEHIEVVGGLSKGARYVTQNSYLIKADIEKSGASHDH
ncbi:efflux RND transporter periplasmic adaptor subunit [Steroidobacter sp.]|uniref:efflux RND transporter periplasmic adaptor subunit n=1 Tax=Steroidobacter sp. TaxID=1978227 RepID=UPI001A53CEA1|nr:efflux RND transporter periplasmic adaptor subunit [Steroidobacter sp.]MBL8268070.1 efflux RND transporter periplasmic adaptor subunit [Steroidobacter sp.]